MNTDGPQRPLLSRLVGDPEIEALFSDTADLDAMLRFEAALASAQAACGLVPGEAAAAIQKACDGFSPDWAALASGMAKDGVVVPALVTLLRRAAGDEHGRFVHFGATSQDVVDTSLMLRFKSVLPILDRRLAQLGEAFTALSERFGQQPLMAHTRMQRALPFTVADKIGTWAASLPRHRARLARHVEALPVQLGGPIGTREAFGDHGSAVARGLADRLGLSSAEPWHVQRDMVVELGSTLSLISGALGKFGADVALMGQNEMGEIGISGGGGSSAMAHKSNPVNAEILVVQARWSATLAGGLGQSMVHENERSGAAWTLEWLTLPQLAITAGGSLRVALALSDQITFPANG